MSNQKPVPPKRGRGRPPKVHTEELPEYEPEPEPTPAPAQQLVNPRFAIPNPNQIKHNTMNSHPAASTASASGIGIDEDLEKIIQQIQDSEMAAAMDESFATYASNTHINMHSAPMAQSDNTDNAMDNAMDDIIDDDMETILQQIREQEERGKLDLELARQLAEADNPAPAFAPGDASADDIDDVLEQIRQMEANEKLKQTGHAYAKPLSIDRVLARQDKEDEEIRKHVAESLKKQEWHNERNRQDREYAESLRKDQEKARFKAEHAKELAIQEQQRQQLQQRQQQVHSPNTDEMEVDEAPVPRTREELRLARMQFFSKPPIS